MTIGIKADLVLGHSKRARVKKDYLWMVSEDSSGLDEIVKPLSEGDCNTSITINLSLNILASYLIRPDRDRLNSFHETQVVRLTTCMTTEYGGGM